MPTIETVKSVQKAFKILNCFTLETPELGITELSRKLKTSKSTMHRLLNSMQNEGFIMQNPSNQRYRLGYSILRLSEIVLAGTNIRNIALPFLKDLRDKTGETTGLNIIYKKSRICIEKAESRHELRRFIEIGKPLPVYAGASGKMLLAHQERSYIEEVIRETNLEAITEKTVTDPERLYNELNEIKAQGHCITYGEYSIEATSISAPVFDHRHNAVASINVSGPGFRFSPDKIEEYKKLVIEAAEKISEQIGYRENR